MISKYFNFENDSDIIKKKIKEKNDKPKLLSKNKDITAGDVFLFFFLTLVIFFSWSIISINFMFIIRYSSELLSDKKKSFYSDWLPDKCDKHPYVSDKISACTNEKIIDTTLVGSLFGGEQSGGSFKYTINSQASKPKPVKLNKQSNKTVDGVAPYKYISGDSILKKWFAMSLAQTNTKVNNFNIEIMKIIHDITNSSFLEHLVGYFSPIILLCIIISTNVLSFFLLLFNQLVCDLPMSGLIFLVLSLIFFIPGQISSLNSLWQMLKISFIYLAFPLIISVKNGKPFINLIDENKTLITIIFLTSALISGMTFLYK